jgi:hypothetical protein
LANFVFSLTFLSCTRPLQSVTSWTQNCKSEWPIRMSTINPLYYAGAWRFPERTVVAVDLRKWHHFK